MKRTTTYSRMNPLIILVFGLFLHLAVLGAEDPVLPVYEPSDLAPIADTNFTAALDYSSTLLDHFQTVGDYRNVLRTYYHLGIINFYEGDFYSAIDAFKAGTEHEHILDFPKNAGSLYNNLGVCYMFIGKYQDALEAYEKSYFLDIQLGDNYSKHQVLVNIAYINHKLGYDGFAENFLKLSYKFFKKEKDNYHLAKILQNLGLIYSERGDYQASINAFNEALSYYKDSNDSIALGQVYYELAFLAAVQKDYDDSFKYFTIGSDIASNSGNIATQARYEFLKGLIFEVKSFHAEAIAQYKVSLGSFIAVSNSEMELEVYNRLSNLNQELGWTNIAEEYAAKADSLNQELNADNFYSANSILSVNQRIKDAELLACAEMNTKQQNYLLVLLALLVVFLGAMITLLVYYRKAKNASIPSEEEESVNTMLFTERLAKFSSAEELLNEAEIGQRRVAAMFIEKMVDSKIYLMEDLSVGKAADLIKTNERSLSRAIKTYFNSSFNNFINSFRVNEAKILLAKDREKRLTIDEVAYQAGFTNRQTFFRVFKQHIGISPSEFRDQGHSELNLNQALSDMEALKNLRKLTATL